MKQIKLILTLLLGASALEANPLSPLVAVGAIPYRAGRWVLNQFKTAGALETEAKSLLSKIDARYGKLNTVMQSTPVDHAQFVHQVGIAHHDYLAHEGSIIRFARKNTCYSDYSDLMNYPFLHLVNRTQALLEWVNWYREKARGAYLSELNSKLTTCADQLQGIIVYARMSQNFASETDLLLKVRNDGRKATRHFLFVTLPLIGAAIVACGALYSAYYLYGLINRVGARINAAAEQAQADMAGIRRAAEAFPRMANDLQENIGAIGGAMGARRNPNQNQQNCQVQ